MKKILVIGDLCTDKFVYGKVDRLSPEAPVPVFIPIETKFNYGMAGNVVNNVKALTYEYDVDLITHYETITKTRYIDYNTNHMFMRVDEGEENIETLELTNDTINRIKDADAVIVSDYNKGFLSLETINEIGKLANLSFLDTKKKIDSDTIENYTFIKLNEDEFKKNMTDDPEKLKKIIATLGRRGAQYMAKTYSVIAKDTIDVSGAGDTFLAALTVNYLQTKDIDVAITFANEMCSIVVSKKGVVTP
jgi:D-beta-D-heptose 7-phosphate kinase/D-beta-D-heptose 1-phosphate adenosyltransferase